MGKQWYIGIDFGTSNTSIVAYEESEGVRTNQTFLLSDHNRNIPTIIVQDGLLDSGHQLVRKCYIGEDANLHPILRPFKGLKNAARQITPENGKFGSDLKPCEYPFEQCGIDTVLQFGNNDYSLTNSVWELLVQFFKEILHNDDLNINKDTVNRIVIGQPVVRGRQEDDGSKPAYETTLKELLAECFTGNKNDVNFQGKVSVIAEPELAGVTYLYTAIERANKKVLVIDIGGGTTDFSVLEYKNGEVEANNIGSCNIAGNAIDDLIFELLPDDVPHSKELCRGLKERLFVEETGTETIVPKETVKLGGFKIKNSDYAFLYEGDETESDYISLNTGKLFHKKINEKSGKGIKDIFNEIGEELGKALKKCVATEINTIFFVGGTSIITPLRECLTDIAEKACGHKLEVVTMFGENTKTLKADGGKPLTVTCYNAVAIGAFIKAMGENIRIIPKLRARICNDDQGLWETTDNDMIIGTPSGVVFARLICPKKDIADWIEVNGQLRIEIIIDGRQNLTLTFTKEQCEEAQDISIAAILRDDLIEFKAFNAGKKVHLKDLMSQTEIQMTQE